MGSMAMIHLITIFASILMLSQAMPNREDVDRLLERLQQSEAREAAAYEELGHNVRNLDALGGGNLIRDTRGMDSLAGITFGGNKRFDSLSGVTFGGQKRRLANLIPSDYFYQPKRVNFDEIDHSGFVGFQKRTNFDEIDHSGFVGFQKRTNFDEIDHSNFDSFLKRANPSEHAADSRSGKTPQMRFRY